MNTFTIPAQFDKNRFFIVNLREIEGRLDPFFYKPIFRDFTQYEKVQFQKLSSFTKSIHHPPEYERVYSENGYQLLRAQNVRPFGIEMDNNKVFFSEEVLKDKSLVFPEIGDVLVVRSGVNAGDTAVIEKKYEKVIIGADNLLIKVNDKVISKFLQVYFYTPFGKTMMSRYLTGATNKHINPTNLGKIPIPLISKEKQAKTIQIFENALESKRQLEAEAEILLGTAIDDYLLLELGIHLPVLHQSSLKFRMFNTTITQISCHRFDPFYNNPIYEIIDKEIHKSPFKLGSFSQVFYSVRGVTFSGKDIVENGLKVLRANNIDLRTNSLSLRDIMQVSSKIEFHDSQKLFKNDILMSAASGSKEHVGKVAFIENDIDYYFGGFMMVLRTRNVKTYPKYLFEYLQSKLFRLYLFRLLGGTNINNLNFEMMRNLQIPIPPILKQEEIADHITDIRKQAQQIMDKTEAVLIKASAEIEEILING